MTFSTSASPKIFIFPGHPLRLSSALRRFNGALEPAHETLTMPLIAPAGAIDINPGSTR
jgi:hypothetical protein